MNKPIRNSLYSLLTVAALVLAGCSSVEHRSDLPQKTKLSNIKPEKTLKVATVWKTKVGAGSGKKDVKLSLAESNGTLFLADQAGQVTAVAADTGKVKWKSNLELAVSGGPSVADGKVAVGTSNARVVTLDEHTGQVLWASAMSSEVLAAPKVTEKTIFVPTVDGGLNALDSQTGRQVWRFNANLPSLMLRHAGTPSLTENTVIAGFANGKLISIRRLDGVIDWSQDVSQPKGRSELQRMVDITADPMVQNGVVYAVSYQGNLVAMTAATGQILWERAIPSYAGFCLHKGLLYISTTQGDVMAIDNKTGETFWTQPILQGRRLSRPAVHKEHLIVGDDSGVVYWIERKTGTLATYQKFDSAGIEATPIIINQRAYVLGRSGQLIALATQQVEKQ